VTEFAQHLRALAIALSMTLPAYGVGAQTGDAPNVAAASDLQFALSEIAEGFRRGTRAEIRLTFGSSGNFTRQIAHGAPFQVFLSADEGFIHNLADSGHTIDRGVLYAVGRLVLFAPSGSPLRLDATMSGLRAALAEGRIRRFAIANPEHAPYGRAAEQVLRGQGLWDSVRPLLVLGENVSQAAQFATSGAAQGGIFAYSLALAPNISGRGAYVLLPAEWHAELAQRMVLLKGAGATAQAFYRYVQEPAARAILRRFGFTLPHES
jgi:molybdate transport system substrate-binding protein